MDQTVSKTALNFPIPFRRDCNFEIHVTSPNMYDLLGKFHIRPTELSGGYLQISPGSVMALPEKNKYGLHIQLDQVQGVEVVLFVPKGSETRDLTVFANCLDVTVEKDVHLDIYGHIHIETIRGSIQAYMDNIRMAQPITEAETQNNAKSRSATHGDFSYDVHIDEQYRVLIWSMWGNINCSTEPKTMWQPPLSIKTFTQSGNSTLRMFAVDQRDIASAENIGHYPNASSTLAPLGSITAAHKTVDGDIDVEYPCWIGTLKIKSVREQVTNNISHRGGHSTWRATSDGDSTIAVESFRGSVTYSDANENLELLEYHGNCGIVVNSGSFTFKGLTYYDGKWEWANNG